MGYDLGVHPRSFPHEKDIVMKTPSLSRLLTALLGTLFVAAAAHAASGTGTPTIAQPKLKSLTSAKTSYKIDEPLVLAVQFEGKQCVFNVEFKAADGSTKTQGYYFNDPSQLTWTLSNPAAYWGVGAGNYTVSAVPHPNPQVAGAAAVRCTGGPVTASLKIESPIQISPAVVPVLNKGTEKPGEKQGAVDMFKPGQKQGAVDAFKPGEKQGAPIYMKPGEKGAPPPAGK
jgi:hypothetical protein